MRAEPSHCSEMVSQLLFGETYRIQETTEEWVQIETHHDNYSGWIQRKQCFKVSDEVFDRYLKADKLRLSLPFVSTGMKLPKVLTMGALIVADSEKSPIRICSPAPNAENWWPADGVPDISHVQRMELLRKSALSLLGAPYLWGGPDSSNCCTLWSACSCPAMLRNRSHLASRSTSFTRLVLATLPSSTTRKAALSMWA